MIEVYPKVRQHHEKDEPAPFRMKRARAVGLKEGFSQSGRNWRSPMVGKTKNPKKRRREDDACPSPPLLNH